MKAKAIILLRFPTNKHRNVVVKSLEPELENPVTPRSSASMKIKGSYLILEVEAKDTVALRATLNAYLRWINSLMNVLETIRTQL
jgi:KEOPS complex subunit Pcc1